MELIDVVHKLVGNINPIGSTSEDERRFENLKVMCNLVDELIGKIADVHYQNLHSDEFSVKKASDFAAKYLSG